MKKKNITTEDLARMIQKGFDETTKQLDETAKQKEVNKRFEKVDSRLEKLEQGQKDIKLRLGNTAFQFDVDDLKKRVRKLEFRIGIKT